MNLIESIDKAERVAIFMHHSADGDAIGSAYGLASALLRGGKDVCVFTAEIFERKFAFLSENGAKTVVVQSEDDVLENLQKKGTLGIVVDCANLDRLSPLTKKIAESCEVLAKIDHHLKCEGSNFADIDCSDHTWAATCEGLYQVIHDYLKTKDIAIDEEIAEKLYTGILTDTGKFVYSSTTGKTLRIVAKLVDIIGKKETFISRQVIDIRSKKTVSFVTRANSRTEYLMDGKLAFTYLRDEDFAEVGASKDDAGVLPSENLNVEGVEYSVIVRPEVIGLESEKKYKVSMRCIDGHNVAKVCNLFGGGGHVCAAGCRFEGDVEEFKATILAEFEKNGL